MDTEKKAPKVEDVPDADVKGEHEVKESVEIAIYYPDHPPRTESPLFVKTKKKLIEEQDVPCWICGSKENREVHHFYVEWAASELVDFELVKKDVPNFDWTTFKDPADFIDSEANMLVLCQDHHRHKDHGIHMMPYPVWILQKYKKADYILTPDDIKK